jgi:hypothetical protein
LAKRNRNFGDDEGDADDIIEVTKFKNKGDHKQRFGSQSENHHKSPFKEFEQEIIKSGGHEKRQNEIDDDGSEMCAIGLIENRVHKTSSCILAVLQRLSHPKTVGAITDRADQRVALNF